MDFAPLRRLMAEDDEHQDGAGTAAFRDAAGEARPGADRRRFLRRAAAGGAVAIGSAVAPLGAFAAAAQTDDTSGASPGGAGAAGGPDDTTGAAGEGTSDTLPKSEACEADPFATGADLATVQFLESLSLAAEEAYAAAIERRLLTAIEAEFARTFLRHHAAQAELLHCAAGGQPGTANARLAGELSAAVAGATDDPGLVRVLHDLEESLAATSNAALSQVSTPEVASVLAAVMPVQAEHAVVWAEVLELPVADYLPTVQSDDGAFAAAEYAA